MSILHATHLVRSYHVRGGLFRAGAAIKAVDGVSLTLQANRTLGLVGESGSGKTTLARLLLGLERPTSGEVRFKDTPMPKPDSAAWRALRAKMQLVYQNPRAALDPRVSIVDSVREPLLVHDTGFVGDGPLRATAALESVGLGLEFYTKRPHELSGGQLQRAVLARAFVTLPEILVCDEPVSALDPSIQAQVIATLIEQQKRSHVSILFISHDLRVVRQVADEVAVMYLGRIVEQGPTERVLHAPRHPYTQALIAAVPVIGPRHTPRILLAGETPDPANPPQGCPFHPRCVQAQDRCRTDRPALRDVAGAGLVACHLVGHS